MISKLINHREAPALLGLVITVIDFIFDVIPKLWIGLILCFLAIVWFINIIWLESKYDLIKEYSKLAQSQNPVIFDFFAKNLKKHNH